MEKSIETHFGDLLFTFLYIGDTEISVYDVIHITKVPHY